MSDRASTLEPATVQAGAPGGPRARVNELDLLRFVAAVAVMLYDYTFRGYAEGGLSSMPYLWVTPVSRYGYLGVNLFFMISGFVIVMSASRGSLKDFLIARSARLYPAFWVCCTLTFLVLVASHDLRQKPVIFSQYLLNMTMLEEFFGRQPVDDVYWSLTLELRFYALVAVVLLLGMLKHAERLLWAWLAADLALDVIPYWRLEDILIADYAPYFIAGAGIYFIWSRGLTLARGALVAVSWVQCLHHSLGWVASDIAHFRTYFDKYVIAAIVTGCFVVLLVVALRRTGRFGALGWTALGNLTYPLYLLHQVIGYVMINAVYPAASAHVVLLGTSAAMIGAAYVIHVGVERPGSRLLKSLLLRAVARSTALLRVMHLRTEASK